MEITDEMVTRAAASVHEWGLSDVPVWVERAIARAALEAALQGDTSLTLTDGYGDAALRIVNRVPIRADHSTRHDECWKIHVDCLALQVRAALTHQPNEQEQSR